MADDEKQEEGTSTRGADWEVVSLTASTYAAAPGPGEFDLDERDDKENIKQGQDTSGSMYMSEHFVFPPSEHENLPIESDYSVPDNQDPVENEVGSFTSHHDYLKTKTDDSIDAAQFIDNENIDSVYGMDLRDGKDSEGSDLVGEEHNVYHSSNVFHDDKDDNDDHSWENLDSPNPKEGEANLPCAAWWKRHAACLYRHAKEANTFWSIVVAAAVMGLVILGSRWKREKLQLQHARWHFSVNDEKLNSVLGPLGRLVGGRNHHIPVIGDHGFYAKH